MLCLVLKGLLIFSFCSLFVFPLNRSASAWSATAASFEVWSASGSAVQHKPQSSTSRSSSPKSLTWHHLMRYAKQHRKQGPYLDLSHDKCSFSEDIKPQRSHFRCFITVLCMLITFKLTFFKILKSCGCTASVLKFYISRLHIRKRNILHLKVFNIREPPQLMNYS